MKCNKKSVSGFEEGTRENVFLRQILINTKKPMPRWYITAVCFKMKKYLIVLSTLVLFAFSSCTKIMLSGNDITKEFIIDGSYTELCVENAFEVTVSDAVSQITVTTDENVMPKVRVEKKGDKLRIYLRPLTVNVGMDLKVILPFNEDLKSVELSGASEFHSEYALMSKNVEVGLSGASEFYCDIDADEVDVDISGASNYYGSINADKIDMELSGASNIESEFSAIELDLNLSGASDATLKGLIDELKIELSGASNIVKQVVGGEYTLVCDHCEGTMSGASEAYIHCDGRICVDLSGDSHLHYTGDGISSGCGSTSGGSSIIGPEHP